MQKKNRINLFYKYYCRLLSLQFKQLIVVNLKMSSDDDVIVKSKGEGIIQLL